MHWNWQTCWLGGLVTLALACAPQSTRGQDDTMPKPVFPLKFVHDRPDSWPDFWSAGGGSVFFCPRLTGAVAGAAANAAAGPGVNPFLALACLVSTAEEWQTIPDRFPVSIFFDPAAPEDAVIRAIRHVSNWEQPATWWTAIANDPKYPMFHRLHCVHELFRHYVKVGMTVGEVSQILRGATWLRRESDVAGFACVCGYIPVHLVPGEDSVFAVNVLPDLRKEAVYLRISGKVTASQMFWALRGDLLDPAIKDAKVLEVWSPGL
jgi:hypothetical protein